MSKLNLKGEEGFRAEPYYCSEGYPTIGYGKRLGPRGAALELYQITIPETVAAAWMESDCEELERELYKFSDTARAMAGCNSDDRRAVLVAMAYQLGVAGLRGFQKALAACAAKNYDAAAREMLDSKWARQTPARARRMAEIMRTGGS